MVRDYSLRIVKNGYVLHKHIDGNLSILSETYVFTNDKELIAWLRRLRREIELAELTNKKGGD